MTARRPPVDTKASPPATTPPQQDFAPLVRVRYPSAVAEQEWCAPLRWFRWRIVIPDNGRTLSLSGFQYDEPDAWRDAAERLGLA